MSLGVEGVYVVAILELITAVLNHFTCLSSNLLHNKVMLVVSRRALRYHNMGVVASIIA